MANRASPEEHKNTLLRTTADIVANSLLQLECCAREWHEYDAEAKQLRATAERLVRHAREVGYVPKVVI